MEPSPVGHRWTPPAEAVNPSHHSGSRCRHQPTPSGAAAVVWSRCHQPAPSGAAAVISSRCRRLEPLSPASSIVPKRPGTPWQLPRIHGVIALERHSSKRTGLHVCRIVTIDCSQPYVAISQSAVDRPHASPLPAIAARQPVLPVWSDLLLESEQLN